MVHVSIKSWNSGTVFFLDSGSLVWNEIMKQIEICISEKVKNHPDNGFRIQIQPNTLKR